MAEKVVRKVSIYVDGDRVVDNIKGIKAEIKKLTNEQSKATIGSNEYVEAGDKLKKLNSIMDEHRNNIKESGSAWDKMKGKIEDVTGVGVGKLALLGSAAMALGASFISGMKGAISLEKSLSQLSALTGAKGSDLTFYRDKALEMGSQMGMSADEIVKSFQLVGSAIPELLKSKEALAGVTQEALILAKASGLDVPDAAKRLTDAMNQYNIAGKDAAIVSNALAAGAKEGAVEIPEQTEAMLKFGAVASSANITIEQSIGMIQALGDKGIKGAEAGTQLRNVLLKLETGAKDTRPSIVGLQTAFENLAKKQLSTTELTKKFGLDSVVAAQNLIKGADKIKYYTNAVTGTNEAYLQAQTNADNLATSWEKFINKLKIGTTSVISKSGITGMLNTVVKGFNSAFDAMSNATKSSTDKFNEQLQSVVKLKQNIEPLADRYDYLKGKTNKSASEQEEMKKIINQVAGAIPSAITQFDKYGNAIGISTTRVRQFINAEVDRLKVMNKKAIGDVEDNLEGINAKIAIAQKKFKEIEKTGTFIKGYTPGSFGGAGSQPIYADSNDIIKVQSMYKELLAEKNGYEAELKRLNGDVLKEEIKRQEDEAKAADEESKKQREAENAAQKKSASDAAKDELNEKKKAKKTEAEKILEEQKKLQQQIDEMAADIAAKRKSAEAQEIREVEKKYAKLAEMAHSNASLLAQLEDLKGQEITSIQVKYNNEEIANFFDKLQTEIDEESKARQELIEGRRDAQQVITDALMTDEERERERIKKHYEELIALAKKYGLDFTGIAAKMQADLDALGKGEKDILGMTPADWDIFTEKFQTVMVLADQLHNMMSAYSERQANREAKDVKDKENNAEREKKSLKRKLDAGIISQKTYESKVEQIDNKLDNHKKGIAQRQFKRQQQLNRIMTIMNTAAAIVGFLKDPGGYAGMALSVVAAITGALQLSAIDSAQMPGYIDGGRVKGKQLAWLSEDGREEGVISNKTLSNPETGAVANWLLDRQDGKQVAFPSRSLPSPAGAAAVSALRSSRQVIVPMRQDDNSINSGGVSYQNSSNEMLAELKLLNSYLSDPENRRAFLTNETLEQREQEQSILKRVTTLKK